MNTNDRSCYILHTLNLCNKICWKSNNQCITKSNLLSIMYIFIIIWRASITLLLLLLIEWCMVSQNIDATPLNLENFHSSLELTWKSLGILCHVRSENPVNRSKLYMSAPFRTQNLEIVYLTLKLQNQIKYKSNSYIIPIGVWETSIKTKRIVAGRDATHFTMMYRRTHGHQQCRSILYQYKQWGF